EDGRQARHREQGDADRRLDPRRDRARWARHLYPDVALVQIEVGKATNVGMIRPGNEDAFYTDAADGLFIVADGMVGHAAGEIASEMAVTILARELKVVQSIDDGVIVLVNRALKQANTEIFQRTLAEVDKQGMGTTASLLILRDGKYLIGQVGDSRVYL